MGWGAQMAGCGTTMGGHFWGGETEPVETIVVVQGRRPGVGQGD